MIPLGMRSLPVFFRKKGLGLMVFWREVLWTLIGTFTLSVWVILGGLIGRGQGPKTKDGALIINVLVLHWPIEFRPLKFTPRPFIRIIVLFLWFGDEGYQQPCRAY
jgi:hypothetical protein